MTKAVTDAVAMETAGVGPGGGLSQRGPLRDWWGPDSAPFLAWWRDLRGWLCQVAPLLLPSGSAALGNPDTQSRCVVDIFLSFYLYCI
jgi:hypothetical protein